MSAVGGALKFAVSLALKIIKPILFIIGIALIVALTSSCIAAIVSLFFGQPYLSYLFPDRMFLANAGIAAGFSLVGMIFVSILFGLSPILFGTRVNRYLQRGAVAVAILSAIVFMGSGSHLARDFSAGRSVEISSASVKNGDLIEIFNESNYDSDALEEIKIQEGNFEMFRGDEELVIKNIAVVFEESEAEDITVRAEVYTRGRDSKEAKQLAKQTNYSYRLEGNKLTLPTYLTLDEGVKFRGQRVKVYIGMPEGKSVKIGKSAREIPFYSEEGRIRSWNCSEWKMGSEGLTCGTEKEKTKEKVEERKEESVTESEIL